MANHKSAAKRARQGVRKSSRKLSTKREIRTFEKSLRTAIQNKKGKEAQELLVKYASRIDKAAQKGILHANNAARKVGRLAKQIQGLA